RFKSYPRNHLYRTSERIMDSPGNGAGFVRFLGQINHLGNITDELDFEASLDRRPEDHLIDQGTDDFDGFGAGGVVFQEALEGGNLALIQGSQVAMEPQRFVQKAGNLLRALPLARLECFWSGVNAGAFQRLGCE